MSAPAETVTAFLARWERPGGFAEAVRAWFTPETVWENVGLSRTTGPDEALTALPGFGEDSPIAIRVDMLVIAVVGERVLTERIDHVLGPDGQPAMSIPLMGIFEVRDGKIAAWRDYFDTAGFREQGQSAG